MATAVLIGALLVGDSMRGSLRHLALDRLAQVDEVLVADHFFETRLAEDICKQDSEKKVVTAAVPAILLSATIEKTSKDQTRANRVQLIGCDERFWELDNKTSSVQSSKPSLKASEIAINQPMADKLGVKPGDDVTLYLPRLEAIPADTALGEKRDTVQDCRLKVSRIIPAEGLGRFGLSPTQHIPLNAFVSLDFLQEFLEKPDQANTIFVHLQDSQDTATADNGSRVQKLLRPKLIDLGLNAEKTAQDYVNITSTGMIISLNAERELLKAIGKVRENGIGIQPAFTNLAITIARGERKVAYSTITAIDFSQTWTDKDSTTAKSKQALDSSKQSTLKPFFSPQGKPLPSLTTGEIALNTWAADELQAKIGDEITVTYFEPESTDGRLHEKTHSFRLAAVVQIAGAAEDRDLTPKVKGITDKDTMKEWEPPFPCNPKLVHKQDEEYWEKYGPIPKAFISLSGGQRLWGSRFGRLTSIRIGLPEDLTLERLENMLSDVDLVAFGMVFQPVKQQALLAAAGTTPFNLLFLAFSFFIIISAVLLVLLLFRLGVDQRAKQIGILFAVGFNCRQVRRILSGEAFLTALIGSLLGLPLGIGYAALLLLGLQTLWLAAIVTPFLQLYITPLSLVVGLLSGVVVAMAAIAIPVRSISRIEPRRLLSGHTSADAFLRSSSLGKSTGKFILTNWIGPFLLWLIIGIVLVLLFGGMPDNFQAAGFFVVGSLALLYLLMFIWLRLRSGRTGPAVTIGSGNIARLALRNAARNPGRSILTIALTAAASFLIVSVSAFQIDTRQQKPTLTSGNGGFSLVAQSDQPIYQSLNSADGLNNLRFSGEEKKLFAGSKLDSSSTAIPATSINNTTAFALRVKSGDDASCLNLYRPREPRVLGVPQAMIDRGGFAWASIPGEDSENPWHLLKKDLPQNADGLPIIPVILEKNTANYSLNLWQGLGETFDISDGQGGKIHLQVVALLDNSIFQGDLLIAETNLLKYFPKVTGYRFFLFETPDDKVNTIREILDRRLSDYGFACQTTAERMNEFLAVQNTYLSTFQSLGGLGLLLGTFGLAAVQLRNVIERRGELALLRAAGFRRRTLAELIFIENTVLLLAGLGCGVIAAFLSILPQIIHRNTPIPWLSLTVTLILILSIGLLAGLLAAAKVLRAPLLAALREDK